MAVRMFTTRALDHSDLDELKMLHEVARCNPPIGIEVVGGGDNARFLSLAESILTDEEFHISGAFFDGELVGVGVARIARGDQGSKQDGRSVVRVDILYVQPEFRKRGIGQLLLGDLADWAALVRASHVVCLPLPHARRARRYLAMMGFLPALSHRVISTALLRRRLGRPRRARLGTGDLFQNHAS